MAQALTHPEPRVSKRLPREQNARFLLAALDAVPDALVAVDGKGRILLANRAGARLLGASRAALEGRSLEDWVSREEWGEWLRACGRTGRDAQVNGRVVRVRPSPLARGRFVLLLDGAPSGEERHALALRGSSVGIWELDLQGGALFWSAKFREMLGMDGVKAADQYALWESRLHPEDRDYALDMLTRHIQKKGPFDVEYRLRRENGDYAWIHATGQAEWDDSGRPLRVLGAMEEITRRKEAEQNLQKALLDLKQSNEELESFTYIASHDLRSPLVNLKGFSEELRRAVKEVVPLLSGVLPQLPEAQQEVLEKEIHQLMPKALSYIIASAEKMERLTSAILQLSRVGHRELVFEPIATGELVRACLKALEHQIAQKGITVEIAPLPDIVGDKLAIEQIFGNLLDNAVKYLDPARPGKIWITGTEASAQTIFCVQDNGRGIAKDDLHKVFEIFRRAGDVEDIPGEGMGMPYVRAIVRQHGGNIWCESNPGRGTAFHFTVARRAAERMAA